MGETLMEPLKQEEFERVIKDILHCNCATSRSIFAFLRRTLRQFNLGEIYEPLDVLMMVYDRVNSQKNVIEKPIPWIRSTALNVIRELCRKEKKQRDLACEAIYQLAQEVSNPLDDQISEEIIEANLIQVRRAWDFLSHKEKELLRWRLMEGLSWKSVQEILFGRGEKIEIDALRQRYSRTLSKLRKLFHSSLKDVM
jgi:DNA-directed RNA polymerase specialized sigma24 family protein